MKKLRIRVPYFSLFFLICFVRIVSFLYASSGDIISKLNSADGSTSMQVKNSNGGVVGSVDSSGNLLVTGSGTVTGAFIVDASSMGIGTSNPTQELEIGGTDSRIYLNSNNSNIIDFGSGTTYASPGDNSAGQKVRLYGSGAVALAQHAIGIESQFMWFTSSGTDSNGGYKWYNGAGTELLRVTGNGNVGVGTTNPTQALEIGGTDSRIYFNTGGGGLDEVLANNGVFAAAPGAGSAGQLVRLWGSGAVATAQLAIGYETNYTWFTSSGTNQNSGFKYYDGNGTEIFRIQSNGNVGIGTQSPAARVHVSTSAGYQGVMVIIATATTKLFEVTSSSVTLGAGGNVYMTGGNFGVGATAPTSALQVMNNPGVGNATHPLLQIDKDGSTTLLDLGYEANGSAVTDSLIQSPQPLQIDVNGQNNLYLSGSSVGMGTSSPGAQLHVSAAAGSTGPQMVVSTGTTNLFEVDGSSIVVAVDIYKAGSKYTNPDYVFDPQYSFMNLQQLEQFIAQNKHLPGVPSTQQVQKHGVQIIEQNRLVLEKLEELYLYLLQMNDRGKEVEKRISHLEIELAKSESNLKRTQ